MTATIHSLSLSLAPPAVATMFAFGGIALGVALRKIALHRLSLLVAAAMGTLLAVTLFDVIPSAKQFLSWPALLFGCASGYLLLWVIGKYIYHVCPACAVNELNEQVGPDLGKTAVLLMIALGLHCTMDGLGIVFGDNLLGHPDAGLLLGMSLHKVPEGLALMLLFLGSGFKRRKAVLWAMGAESMTIVGGIIGSEFLNPVSTFWLGLLFAQVGGSFLYMIATAVKGVLGQHSETPRYAQHALVSGLSFISSAAFLGLVAK